MDTTEGNRSGKSDGRSTPLLQRLGDTVVCNIDSDTMSHMCPHNDSDMKPVLAWEPYNNVLGRIDDNFCGTVMGKYV